MIQNPLVLANRILETLIALPEALRAVLTPHPQNETGIDIVPGVPLPLQEALARLDVGAPLTTEQVLGLLDCSEKSLGRLVKRSGKVGAAVPRWKLGGRWRWDGGAVVDWATALSDHTDGEGG
jgi:hypothetical protein